MATIEQLKKMKISEMDSNMYQKYKNWCMGEDFSGFTKFNTRYRFCDFYVNGKKIDRCVAFANYSEQFHKAFMTEPERLIASWNYLRKRNDILETYRHKEFTIVKKCS